MFTPAEYRALRLDMNSRKPEVRQRATEGLIAAIQDGTYKPEDLSIRHLFESTVEDGYELIQETCDPRVQGTVSPRRSLTRLIESDSVNTSAFSSISGQLMITTVLKSYEEEVDPFVAMIPTVPTRMNGERIPGITEIGDKAEDVAERDAYPRVGVGEDYIDTPQTTKSGLIIEMTKEALFFDRTGLLLGMGSSVGKSLRLRRRKKAIDCIIDENRTVHRYNRKGRGAVATYGDNSGNHDWDNLQASNALADWTDVDNADALLAAIRDPNTGEPLAMSGKTPKLIVARGLKLIAEMIRNATEILTHNGGYATSGTLYESRGPNPYGGRFDVVSSQLFGDRLGTDTSWFYGHPEEAFAYMENWAMTVVQAPANNEDEFNRDIAMKWKASERGQYITREPRKMIKCTA